MNESKALDEQVVLHTANIANGAVAFPSLGGVATARPGMDCKYRPYLRFGLYSDVILTLTIESSMDDTVYTVDQTLITTANAWFHVYDLPSPRNQSGFYVLGSNYVRFQIANNTAAPSTVLSFLGAIRNIA